MKNDLKYFVILCAYVSLWFNADSQEKPFVLKAGNFKHYVDYFSKIEDENIKNEINNDSTCALMKNNITKIKIPQQNFQKIFY